MKKRRKNKKEIELAPGAHVPNLRIWCSECETTVRECRANGETIPLLQCVNMHALSYRAVIFIPGTKDRIVRSLGKNFTEALKRLAILKQQIENGEIMAANAKQQLPENPKIKTKIATEEPKVTTALKQTSSESQSAIAELFGKFLAMLKGEGIASHLAVIRSKGHYNDVKNCFNKFSLALIEKGFDVRNMHLDAISNDSIGIFHDFLKAKQYSNATYNRFIGHLGTFASWAENEGYGDIRRFIDRVPRKSVTPNPEIISRDEFEKTISAVSRENGFQHGVGKDGETRNHFRDFLIPSFKFGLITGRRLEELITCRFSDVHVDEHGRPLYITFIDHKVSRIMHVELGNERKVHTPVTRQIMAFLSEQGFLERGPSDFILAPEIIENRVPYMRQCISRGFSHFYKVAHPDSTRAIGFKHLRKTYLTSLAIYRKGQVRDVSGHSSDQVLKHYLNEEQMAIAASLEDFEVLGKNDELKELRNKPHQSEHSIER